MDDDESGTTGQRGAIEFSYKDAFTGPTRDDLLSPQEIKRLTLVQKEAHEAFVNKQKILRESRANPDKPKYDVTKQQQKGYGHSAGGGTSQYKQHRIASLAQFSGTDKQVSGIPTLSEQQTNEAAKESLENSLQNRYVNQPKFNPKPRPPGG